MEAAERPPIPEPITITSAESGRVSALEVVSRSVVDAVAVGVNLGGGFLDRSDTPALLKSAGVLWRMLVLHCDDLCAKYASVTTFL